LIMLVVEWLEDVGCGCEETSPYVACSTRSHEADNMSCERLQTWKWDESSVRGCKNWEASKLASGVDTGYDVFVKRHCGSCERTAKFGAEENVTELWTPPWEGGKTEREKNPWEGGKIEREEKNLSIDLLATASSSSVFP
jgi:hypothetical protein